MVGALLNASFGSITELTLYTLAIRKGSLDDLILYSVTGGLLSGSSMFLTLGSVNKDN